MDPQSQFTEGLENAYSLTITMILSTIYLWVRAPETRILDPRKIKVIMNFINIGGPKTIDKDSQRKNRRERIVQDFTF